MALGAATVAAGATGAGAAAEPASAAPASPRTWTTVTHCFPTNRAGVQSAAACLVTGTAEVGVIEAPEPCAGAADTAV